MGDTENGAHKSSGVSIKKGFGESSLCPMPGRALEVLGNCTTSHWAPPSFVEHERNLSKPNAKNLDRGINRKVFLGRTFTDFCFMGY